MRVQILSTDGAQYLAWAKQRLQVLSDLRASLNVPALERVLLVGSATIYLRATELEDLVRISGGGLDLLLLFNGTEVWGYDWHSGKLEKRLGLTADGTLVEGWGAGSCALTDTALLTAKKTGVTKSLQDIGGVTQHVIESDALVMVGTTGFTLLTAAGRADLLTTLPRILDSFTQMDGLCHAVTIDVESQWNATKTVEACMLSLFNPAQSTFVHRWAPRVFYPELGTAAPLPPARGLFYGALPTGDIPAEEIKVTFGGYLDDRHHDLTNACEANDFRTGYCETLREMTLAEDVEGNPVTPYVVTTNRCSFIPSLWTPNRSTFYSRPALPGVGYKFAGSSHQATTPQEKFSIDFAPYFAGAPVVHWWSTLGDAYPPETPPENRFPLHGILATDNDGWCLHTWRGYVAFMASGLGYIGHSVSTNGEFVAVFTGAEGVITEVAVYNVQLGTLVRTKAVTQGFTSGVIIPTVPLNPVVAPSLPEAPALFVDTTEVEMESSLGGFTLLPTGQFEAPALAAGWKTVIIGREAVSSKWTDPCWANAKVTIIRPLSVEPQSLLTENYTVTVDGVDYTSGGWAGMANVLPFLLWFVAGDGIHNEAALATWDETTISPMPATGSANLEVFTYERAETLNIGLEDPLAINRPSLYASSNAVGPVVWSASPPDAIVENEDGTTSLINPEGCYAVEITGTDACGIAGVRSIEETPTTPLTVALSGDYEENVDGSVSCYNHPALMVGIEVTVTGGMPPYQIEIDEIDAYSIDIATGLPYIDEEGVIQSLPAVPPRLDDCYLENINTLVAYDDCGKQKSPPLCGRFPPNYNAVIDGPAIKTESGEYTITNLLDLPANEDLVIPLTYQWRLKYLEGSEYIDCGSLTATDTEATTNDFTGCGCETILTYEGTREGAGTPCVSGFIELENPALEITGPTTGIAVDTQFSASGGIAPYTWEISQGTIDSTGKVLTLGCPTGGDDVTITVTDACGTFVSLSGEYAWTVLSISGQTNNVIVGTVFSGSGGKAPYTFSVSKGSINSTTGAITAISCVTGTAAAITVTVTDACGATAEMVARYQSGQWVAVCYADTINNTGGGCAWGTPNLCTPAVVSGEVISGDMRYVTTYRLMLADFEPENPDYGDCLDYLARETDCGSYSPGPYGSASLCGVSLPSGVGTLVSTAYGYKPIFIASQSVYHWECL